MLLTPMTGEVTVTMNASREAVWDLVSDITRIGEFSPETFEGKWTKGSTGPQTGATFSGHVRRNGVGPTYWAPCQVTHCVPGEVFEFAVVSPSGPLNNWGYRLAAGGGAGSETVVTEYYRLAPALPMKVYWMLLGRLRAKTNRDGMRTTLERIKAVVEAEARA